MDGDGDPGSRARARALEAWTTLDGMRRPGSWRRDAHLLDGPWPGAGQASVWALSQPLAAAVALLRLGLVEVDAVAPYLELLGHYRVADGYGPYPKDRNRFYDDNAWIGLDLVGLHLATGDPAPLAHAGEVLAFVRRGEAPDGGVLWEEKRGSPRNTCSTAPAAQLALWIHLLTGDPDALAFAERCRSFLEATLRRDDRLYADHIDTTGRIDHSLFSYNQGTPIGVDVLLHRITGDRAYLESATDTASASLAHFAERDQIWTHQPCFNAIWFRNLVALDAVDPQPGLWPVLDAYAERLWTDGRDPSTGWFTRAGIGCYERGGVLDQGGVVQILALPAWPREAAATLV